MKKAFFVIVALLVIGAVVLAGCTSTSSTQSQKVLPITDDDNGVIGLWGFPVENKVMDYRFLISKENGNSTNLKAIYGILLKDITDEDSKAMFGGGFMFQNGDSIINDCVLEKIGDGIYRAKVLKGVIIRDNQEVGEMLSAENFNATMTYDKKSDILFIDSEGVRTPLERIN